MSTYAQCSSSWKRIALLRTSVSTQHATPTMHVFTSVCSCSPLFCAFRPCVRPVLTLPLALHAAFMTLYAGVLLFSQGPMVFNNLTTNEQFNGWRYKYMTRDLRDTKGKAMLTPFSEGRIKNCASFFRLRKGKHVAATVEMASSSDAPSAPSSHAGGQQLPEAAFDWDGIEHLQQGIIVTPENEQQAFGVLRYMAFQKALGQHQANGGQSGGGHGHSHGGGGGGGGHGHSHGGRECQGH
jgi:hypothetical protein